MYKDYYSLIPIRHSDHSGCFFLSLALSYTGNTNRQAIGSACLIDIRAETDLNSSMALILMTILKNQIDTSQQNDEINSCFTKIGVKNGMIAKRSV